jgi:hypothetical protein
VDHRLTSRPPPAASPQFIRSRKAAGARVTATIAHHIRHNGIRYALQAICEGGGMANATILELCLWVSDLPGSVAA